MLPRVATDLNLLLFRRGKFLRRMMIILKKRRNMVDKLFSLLGTGADNGHVKLRNPAHWLGLNVRDLPNLVLLLLPCRMRSTPSV